MTARVKRQELQLEIDCFFFFFLNHFSGGPNNYHILLPFTTVMISFLAHRNSLGVFITTNIRDKTPKSMICQLNNETYTLAAEENACKSGIFLKWNHPVFHKFIAQSEYPTLPHLTTIASLFQGTVA